LGRFIARAFGPEINVDGKGEHVPGAEAPFSVFSIARTKVRAYLRNKSNGEGDSSAGK
jgi:hypothetical protein